MSKTETTKDDTAGWRSWFAWHPIKIDGHWIWWKLVERKFYGGGLSPNDGVFDYRLPQLVFGCTAEDIDEINY